jgi:hypothetical protein
MKRWMKIVVPGMILAAGLIVLAWPLAYEKYRQAAEPKPYQLVYSDGKRSWSLDTGSLRLKTEEGSGIPYLEVNARITYTFTENYDINHYWMQTDARKWQPISATGCDKAGNVVES